MNPRRERTGPHEARYLIEDLGDGLVWPLLLRGPGLALRPQRVLFGIAAVVLTGLIASVGRLWTSADQTAFGDAVSQGLVRQLNLIWSGVVSFDGGLVVAGVGGVFALPGRMVHDYPVSVWALGVPMFAVWALFTGAIARGVACEAAGLPVPAWTRALGFALRRWVSFLLAWAVPIVVVVIAHLVLAVGGFVLLSVPVLDVVGGVLYGLAALLGLVSVVVHVLLVLGGPMLIPAIATEGTDAIDGQQRAFGYVFGRPLRLVVYLLLALVIGGVAVGLAGLLAGAVDARTSDVMTSWTSAETNKKVDGPTPDVAWPDLAAGAPGNPFETPADEPAGTDAADASEPVEGKSIGEHTGEATYAVIDFWRGVFMVLVAGFGMSYFTTAATLVYLCARRVNDGQDVGEVWQPT